MESSSKRSDTQLKQKISELQDTLGKMEAAFASIIEGILWTNHTGKIQWCNSAFDKLVNKPHIMVLGNLITELVPLSQDGKPLKGMNNPFSQVYQHGKNIDIRCEYLRDNKTHILEIRGAYFRYKQGELTAVFVIRDISKRIQLELELLQAQKLEAIGSLSAGIAHEINTPAQYLNDNLKFIGDEISHLIEFAQACQSFAKADSESVTLADKIKALAETKDMDYLCDELPQAVQQSLEGIDHISKIVRSVKAFSHPGADTKTITQINECIENTVNVSRNEWKYNANISLDLDKELSPVLCFPGEINQVFLNMIINAAHAIESKTEDMGEISISTDEADAFVRIRIKDSGCGMPESVQQQIFNPFFTTKAIGKGTGQGLHIAWKIITQNHDGAIEVDSTEGDGTTFTIMLPKNAEP